MPATRVVLGKPNDWPAYGWDNEYGRREVAVQPFRAARRLVSNGEYYEFVMAGGYREQKYWSDTGWSWRTFRNLKWPTFWVPDGPAGLHRYKLRTLFETIEMPWNWPAEVEWPRGACLLRLEERARRRALPAALGSRAPRAARSGRGVGR